MSTADSAMDRGGTVWDAPNQQVVREDGSAPWDEGEGGGAAGEESAAGGLEAMTKADLIAYAQAKGISPANEGMTKAELIASIQAGGG